MNLADPELELLDPTPNIYSLFVHFDSLFFWTALVGRALVRWSKRMYSCAGVCSFEGKNGLCDIALSEPLLKLRPRKDLVETLLHEMIHAYLFITNRDNDRDGHGPTFQAHMHRINKAAGLNISIYHDFHDEVRLYLKHWWRCNGPCQSRKPYFGIVRRSANRAPGPNDTWWESHRRNCGGTFIKIKEPEKVQKVPKSKEKAKGNDNLKQKIIDVYIDKVKDVGTPNNIQIKRNVPTSTQTVHNGNLLTPNRRKSTDSCTVINKVRDVWANKQLPNDNPLNITQLKNTSNKTNSNKHKVDSVLESTPKKIKKIDDYFKATANSIIKDIYGKDVEVVISSSNNKFRAITNNKILTDTHKHKSSMVKDLVDCPNCNAKVNNEEINQHLDECLNKNILEKLTNEYEVPSTSMANNKTNLKDFVGTIQAIPPYKSIENKIEIKVKTEDIKIEKLPSIGGLYKPSTSVNKKKQTDFIIPKAEDEFINSIKNEPSTSKAEVEEVVQKCPCCGIKVEKPIEEHLDECLAFFDNNTTIPIEGTSAIDTIVIDDEDDEFDETLTLNATGTKSPCPCCLKMVEITEMNSHLDVCLN